MHHPNNRIGSLPTHATKQPRRRNRDRITHGVIHMTGVEGKTADQHFRYHTNPKPYGRDWSVGAYTSYIGLDARRELLLDYETVAPHAGNLNGVSIGVVVEGNLNARPPSPEVLDAVVQECIYHDTALGRRLVWTFHNDVMAGRSCPGDFFPKAEVLARIEAHYAAPEPTQQPTEEPEEDYTIPLTWEEQPDQPTMPLGCVWLLLPLLTSAFLLTLILRHA